MKPSTFLNKTRMVEFDFNHAEERAAPAMQTLHQILNAVQLQPLVQLLTSNCFVNLDWLETVIQRRLKLSNRDDWAVIAADVIAEVLEVECPICKEGHAAGGNAILEACCSSVVHARCKKAWTRGCAACGTTLHALVEQQQGALTAAMAAGLVAAHREREVQLQRTAALWTRRAQQAGNEVLAMRGTVADLRDENRRLQEQNAHLMHESSEQEHRLGEWAQWSKNDKELADRLKNKLKEAEKKGRTLELYQLLAQLLAMVVAFLIARELELFDRQDW